MVRPQEKNGWARLDEQQNLRRLLDGSEAGEWLLDPIIEDAEVFATQAFDKVTAAIGDNHPDIDAVNADSNRRLRRLPVFLGVGEKTRAEQGGEEQCRQQTTKRAQ